VEGGVFAKFLLQDSKRGEYPFLSGARGAMDEEVGVAFGGDEVVGVRELFEDGDHVFLHDRGRRFAHEGEYVVGGEGGSAPVPSKEGDRGLGTSELMEVSFDLLEECGGISAKRFGEGKSSVSGLAADDPGGRCGRFRGL